MHATHACIKNMNYAHLNVHSNMHVYMCYTSQRRSTVLKQTNSHLHVYTHKYTQTHTHAWMHTHIRKHKHNHTLTHKYTHSH